MENMKDAIIKTNIMLCMCRAHGMTFALILWLNFHARLTRLTTKAIAVLLVAVAHCQETLEENTSVSDADDRKEKRGISLNLGNGLEGYSYLGPSTFSRGMNHRGYTPITELGNIEINWDCRIQIAN